MAPGAMIAGDHRDRPKEHNVVVVDVVYEAARYNEKEYPKPLAVTNELLDIAKECSNMAISVVHKTSWYRGLEAPLVQTCHTSGMKTAHSR
jgi:hypothetical protein